MPNEVKELSKDSVDLPDCEVCFKMWEYGFSYGEVVAYYKGRMEYKDFNPEEKELLDKIFKELYGD